MWLYTTFEITLFAPVFVRAQSAQPMTMEMNVDGYDVEVQLFLNSGVGRFKKQGDSHWHYMATALEVSVAYFQPLPGNEKVAPNYLELEILPQLQKIAERATNQLATYLKYKMWHSLFYAVEMCQEQGQIELVPMSLTATVDELPQSLQACIDGKYSHALSLSLMADAEASLAHHRVHRACLDLTLACEVALESLFNRDSTSVMTKLLIGQSGGESFKQKYPQHYESISQLFQVREVIAEGSDGLFKCNAVLKQLQHSDCLREWQAAVECLVGESQRDERLVVDF